MEKSLPQFKMYVLVCEHEREEGDFCGASGTGIREILKNKVKQEGLQSQVRVSRTGCLDVCAQGPNVLLMPQNIWFKKVQSDDIDQIFTEIKNQIC